MRDVLDNVEQMSFPSIVGTLMAQDCRVSDG
jgi:hypothetical protein